MAETDAEKSEAPTPRRLQEARDDGNIPKSTDLTAALSLIAAVFLLYIFGGRLLGGMKVILAAMLSNTHTPNPSRALDVVNLPVFTGTVLLQGLVPLTLGVALVALVVTICQVGFVVTTKPLEIDLTKLSPLKGLKNMVSMRGWTRLVMSLGKVSIIGAVASLYIYMHRLEIIKLAELPLLAGMTAAWELVFMMALWIGAVLLILAVADYAYQRWQHHTDLKMTKQEVKEELKRMDGDPMIKQRRARVARQLAMQRTAASVPQADVIVTNPTHFAIALKYDSATMRSPKLIAKGADIMAFRIRQIAMQHEIPIVERKELARGLYRNVEVGQEVPPEYYAAVAEILAYVYRLNRREEMARA
ncbi:MAG: flagellar biosynthesis protein FlhB [Phycisphaeraceae bacterium]|nr:flagellar biosynthesis protein FlhB [Phycisphaeraceae bacterium]